MMQDSKLQELSIAPSWLEDNQQRETDYQDWRDRSGTDRQNDLAQDGRQHLMAQRRSYADWQAEQEREMVRPGGAGKGLDRHDFYNLDTAHELEDAIGRAAAQGVDYSKPDKFQRFLEREAEAGVGQVEGKRSLFSRYQELQQQSQEAASLTERGARPDQIPEVKLHESAQEQRFRVEQERSLRGQERSPARERLAEIRQQHGISETNRDAEQQVQQSHGRGRSR
jgi:hypothetical protein